MGTLVERRGERGGAVAGKGEGERVMVDGSLWQEANVLREGEERGEGVKIRVGC